MADKIQLLLEAEKRGILSPDKSDLLEEARNRGLVPRLEPVKQPVSEIPFGEVGRVATRAATAPLTGQALQTPEALGVGQGAIQAVTGGFGVPSARKVAGGIERIVGMARGEATPTQEQAEQRLEEQVRPPTLKESLVGAGLSTAVLSGATAAPKIVAGIAKKAISPQSVAKSIAAGGGIGFTVNPSDIELVPLIDKRRFTNAAIGAATAGLANIAGKMVRGISNIQKAKNPGQFAEKVQSVAGGQLKAAGKKFEKQLELLSAANPDKKVSIRNAVLNAIDESVENRKVKTAVRELFEKPDLVDEVTLPQAQEIINKVQSKIAKSKLGGVGIRPDDLPLMDFVAELRDAQLSAFPDMKQVRAEYGKTLNNWKVIKGLFKEGRLIKNVKENFGDAQIQQRVNQFLPENIIREMGGFRSAANFLQNIGLLGEGFGAEAKKSGIPGRILRRGVEIGTAGAIGGAIGSRLFGGRGGGGE